jgi:hypothetical protein
MQSRSISATPAPRGGGDPRGHQTAGAATDHDEVVAFASGHAGQTRAPAPRFGDRLNRPSSNAGPSAVGDDLDPELRRLRRAAMFLAVCVGIFVIATLIGVFH